MNVVFRCDASIQIGTGHVMRCLTLADELTHQGAKCHFICREQEGNLIDFIAQKGYEVYKVELVHLDNHIKGDVEPTLFHSKWLGTSQADDARQTVDIVSEIQPQWLVIDHYALNDYWEKKLRPYCDSILVVDDLADRKHDCDILLDQNYGSTQDKYKGLVPKTCLVLAGTKYTLLRPEFIEWRDYSLQRRKNLSDIKRILITLGGTDPDNYTGRILQELSTISFRPDTTLNVIMGTTAPNIASVKQQASKMPILTHVLTGVSNMAELMSNADLAIGAAGATTWERCCLGVPSIQLVIAENQKKIALDLERRKIVKILFNIEELPSLLGSYQKWLTQLHNNSKNIVDGKGANRVSDYILNYIKL